jgi:hypothetical protein
MERKVRFQQAGKSAQGWKLLRTILVLRPHLGCGVDEVSCPVHGNSVVSPEPVDVSLKEIENGVPPRSAVAHGSEVKREGGGHGFVPHGYAVAFEDGCLDLVNQLATNHYVDVFGANPLVVVGVERLF